MPDTRKRIARKENTVRRLAESGEKEDKAKSSDYDYPVPEDSWPGSENGDPENDWPRTDNPVGRLARESRSSNRRDILAKEDKLDRNRQNKRQLNSRRGRNDPPTKIVPYRGNGLNLTNTKQLGRQLEANDDAFKNSKSVKQAAKKRLMNSRRR